MSVLVSIPKIGKFYILLSLVSISLVSGSPQVDYSVISEVEKDLLKQFRVLVGDALYQDYMKTDVYLIRWIRDKYGDLEEANEKLRKSLQWRKDNRIDEVLKEDFTDIKWDCPIYIGGHDKEYRPIVTMSLGQCDFRRLVTTGRMKRAIRNTYYSLEKVALLLRQIMKTEKGKNVRNGIFIVDLAGFNLRQLGCLNCFQLLTNMALTYENNYPEFLHQAYFINVPKMAQRFVDLAEPYVPPRTVKLTEFFYDKDEWRRQVMKTISPDQLTVQFGGTRVGKF